jgi:hypothetical protein
MNIDSVSELSRAQIEAAARKRQQSLELKAEQAAGVGQPDDDEFKAEDRQPDGRLPWQLPSSAIVPDELQTDDSQGTQDGKGRRGTKLDISG